MAKQRKMSGEDFKKFVGCGSFTKGYRPSAEDSRNMVIGICDAEIDLTDEEIESITDKAVANQEELFGIIDQFVSDHQTKGLTAAMDGLIPIMKRFEAEEDT